MLGGGRLPESGAGARSRRGCCHEVVRLSPGRPQSRVRAVFAFSLQVGTARLGALDVYRDEPGAMSARALARAPAYAHVALQMILDAPEGPIR